jgi:hypothetical protein
MIHIAGTSVCANCKPVFMQEMAEGVLPRPATESPIYFPVSTLKLALLSLASLGLYQLYWFYRNWSLEDERTKEGLHPFWRTVFAPIFAYSLFHRMYEFAGNSSGNPLGLTQSAANREVIRFKYHPGFLAGLYFVLTICARLPYSLWTITLLAFIPLVLVQRSVDQINKVYAPAAPSNRKFSWKNILVLVFGGMVFLLAMVGTFMPK